MPKKKEVENERGAKPFVKWVGGKRQLMEKLLPHVPKLKKGATYHEPFVGGGAFFFALGATRALLSDTNERLVRTYRAIKESPGLVIERLKALPHTPGFFAHYRAEDVDLWSDVEVATWFIYLNKTGFNGLYRVNRAGKFNVPFGDYKNPNICDSLNILACARALRFAQVGCCGFEAVLGRAKAGDFAYFDPPYVPLSKTSNFTSFTRDGFTVDDQTRLRDVALELKRRKVRVLLSNSSAELVMELYSSKFKIENVLARRNVNSKAGGRGEIGEVLIY